MILIQCCSVGDITLYHLFSWMKVGGVEYCLSQWQMGKESIVILQQSQNLCTDMYSTHISFIRASPIAMYDIIRGKNYNLTMYLKEKKLEIFVCSISDSPKHLYQYMIYCFIQNLVFLVSCFSTIFTLVYLNFTEILTVKVFFAVFYLDLMTYQRFMFLFVCLLVGNFIILV